MSMSSITPPESPEAAETPPSPPTTHTAAGVPIGPRSVAHAPAAAPKAAIVEMPPGVSAATHVLRRRPGFPPCWVPRAPKRVSRHDQKLIARDREGGLLAIGQQALRNAEVKFGRRQEDWEKVRGEDNPRKQKKAWARLERARITLETVRANLEELARRIAAGNEKGEPTRKNA